MKKLEWKKDKKQIIYGIIFVISLAVFIFSAVKLIGIAWNYYTADKEYEQLEEYIAVTEDDTEYTLLDTEMRELVNSLEAQEKGFSVDFEKLHEINPDCVGWIRYETLKISYPIVQGTDNDYYLTHTFYGNVRTAASIFMDYNNSPDYSDFNTFIYGHKMKDKSMFGLLTEYSEESFYKENPGFYIYTPEGVSYYTIFSCYEANVYEQEDTFTNKFSSADSYQNYLNKIKQRSVYDTGVEVDSSKHMVSLMTCTRSGEDYRFLVHAVKTNEWTMQEWDKVKDEVLK